MFHIPEGLRHLDIDIHSSKFIAYSTFWVGIFGYATDRITEMLQSAQPGTAAGWLSLCGVLIGIFYYHRTKFRESESRIRIREMKIKAEIDAKLAESRTTQRHELEGVHRTQVSQGRKLKRVTRSQAEILEKVKDFELLRSIGFVSAIPEAPTILLVEDDPITLTALSRFLRSNLTGFSLELARDMDQAIRMVEHQPDWILLDMILDGQVHPGEDVARPRIGLELVPLAKAANQDVKILIITGDETPEHLAGAAALGVDVWMKPMSPQKLTQLVMMLRKDFGPPPPSSDQIQVFPGPPGDGIPNPRGTTPDGSAA